MEAMKVLLVCLSTAGLLGACTQSAPDPVDLDAKATSLRQKLGSLCDNFDFQLKERVAEGTVRPINCKGPAGRDSELRLFVFTDDQTRDAWKETSPAEVGSGEAAFGEGWAVISSSSEITDEAQRRLDR